MRSRLYHRLLKIQVKYVVIGQEPNRQLTSVTAVLAGRLLLRPEKVVVSKSEFRV